MEGGGSKGPGVTELRAQPGQELLLKGREPSGNGLSRETHGHEPSVGWGWACFHLLCELASGVGPIKQPL